MAEHIEWLGSVFGGMDVLEPNDVVDYFDCIRDAFQIHVEKERLRNGHWKEYPTEDQNNCIKLKSDRVTRTLERLNAEGHMGPIMEMDLRANATEELHDIINYAVFALRILNGKV